MSSSDQALEKAATGADGVAITAAPSALISAALAQLAEGVVVADAAGRITFVNDAAARLHGVARLDVAPADYAKTYHLLTEDGRPYPSEELPLARAVLRGETVLEARWRIRRPDGTEVCAVGSARPVVGPGGGHLGAVLTLRDETALRHAERRAERLLEQVADAHLTMDAEFRILSINRAAEAALDLSRETVVGHVHWDVFPASLGSELERRYRRVVAQGIEEHFTHHYVGEGNERFVEIDAYPTSDGGVAVFWRDISARLGAERALVSRNEELAEQAIDLELANQQLNETAAQLESANIELHAISEVLTERTLTAERTAAALAASERYLRTLADALPTLAWTALADGYIDWYNARWHSYTGSTPAEMEGWGWQSVHDPRVLPDVMTRWRASIETGEPFEMTFPLRSAGGDFRRFVTRVVPMRDAEGRVLRWFGTNTDIEDERAAREAAEQAVARTERLQELTAAFGGATTVDDVAAVIVGEVGGPTRATTATLLLRVPGSDDVMIHRHAGLDAVAFARFERMSIHAPSIGTRSMRLRQPIFVQSREELDAVFPELSDLFVRHGTQSVASVPLITGGTVYGAVTYSYGIARTFTRADRDFHVAIGHQVAQALERARLLASERAATERAERLQKLISRLNVAHSSEEIADAVFSGAMEAVQADAGSFGFVIGDGEGAQFRTMRSAGHDASVASRYQQFPLISGRPLSDAVSERRLTLVGSAAEWSAQFPTAPESLRDLGFEAFVAVPVVANGRALAALTFCFCEPRSFDDAMCTFLGTIGEQCALALERQFAHDAQLQQADEHSALLETIQDAFVAFDRQMRYTYVNARAESLLQRPAADLVGRTPLEAFPAVLGSPFDEMIRRVLDTGEGGQVEAIAPTINRWLDARMYPAPHGVSVVLQDVTERRRAQDAATFMSEASRLLSASLDYEATLVSLAEAVVPILGDWCAVDMLVDPDVETWPPNVRRIAVMHENPARIDWARELAEKIPQDWSSPSGLPLVLREGVPQFYPRVTDDMLVAAAKSAEHLALIREIGMRSWLCVPLQARGRTLGALTLCMAESGRHYETSDLLLVQDLAQRAATAVDNARLYRDAERARLAAEAANFAKSEFLSTMSHELRTPLNAIGGYAELLSLGIRGPVTDAQQQDLARLTRANQHLKALINDVLSYARVERGHVEVNIETFEIGPMIADLEALVGPQLASKGLTFDHDSCTPDTPESPHMVLADVEKVRQILLNVLTNAVKFTPHGGHVALACRTDSKAGVVRLSVRDTGRGIPADQLERIFEPFVQVERHLTQDSQQGIGLGLAISRDLARAMGGDLTATSDRSAGSTFTLALPCR